MLRWGLGPRKNADSVHSGTHSRFQGSTQDQDRDRPPEHILVFRALLEIEIEIEIELRNTSSFLGLYSRSRWRSRLNSGTHTCFQGSTQDRDQDRDQTPEHILVFRALLEIEIEIEITPVHGHEKGTSDKQRNKDRNLHTSRLLDQLCPEGQVGENLRSSCPLFIAYQISLNYFHCYVITRPGTTDLKHSHYNKTKQRQRYW